MAVQEHFEGFDQEADESSKSAQKREAQEIRALAETICKLGLESYKKLKFPDESIKEALDTARNLKINSDERRRQLQYVAKLMRQYELDELTQGVQSIGQSSKEDPKTAALENLREYFLDKGILAVNSFCQISANTDRNKLRHLLKKAQEEIDLPSEASKPNCRALFKFLKQECTKNSISLEQMLEFIKD